MRDAVLFEPPFPMQTVVGVGVLVLILALVAYRFADVTPWKRACLVLLRLLILSGVVLVLCRPMAVKPKPESGEKPILTVLVDSSASMNTKDEGKETSRTRAVAAALEAARRTFTEELAARYQINFQEFSEEVAATTLEQLVGRDSAGGDVGRVATHLRGLKIPVWTTPVGALTETKDLYVSARLNQNFTFVRQPAIIKVDVTQSGYKNWYAKVDLYREDKYVMTRQVNLKDGTTALEFPIKEDHKGVFKYSVQVEPLLGEADARNNRRSLFVRVVDEKPKVLLVEAEPYWDTRFLLRVLQADPNLEVSSVFQLSPTKRFAIQEKTSGESLEKQSVRTAFGLPRTKDELYEYDCLILGRGIDGRPA